MEYDYTKLRRIFKFKFGTQAEFALAMGMSERTMSLKLNNEVFWKQPEIQKAIALLDIDLTDIHTYFFKQKSQ